ncbi:DNA mismatch endonuclease Vsr [Mangrovivirga sp. M17]|uniref:Very short patch repair endonuclease n=1 Tax=Mangrovivirga halotolerans TaxID=2993936 RepID=A0ABT3RPE3_9BACT|nr:DNA mismatch endonuclease Vsr [Mangrovivirga halotolerans]MCX2743659.1 DNA mismatch endonuclease Vsr [Mangrovivirga halotolerans]
MADVHDKDTRSYNMSKIRHKNTKPELIVRKFLFSNGYRYRIHDKKLPGKPDIVLPKYKTIIDIRGCYFHQHKNCKYATIPKTRTEYYLEKFKKNVERDSENVEMWEKEGWEVIIVWADCQLEPKKKNSIVREETLNKINKALKWQYQ